MENKIKFTLLLPKDADYVICALDEQGNELNVVNMAVPEGNINSNIEEFAIKF